MKLRNSFAIGALTLGLLMGCSANNQKPSGGNGGEGGGSGEENNYSQVLKDCGSQIMQLSNSSQTPSSKRGFVPYQNAPAQAIAFPGVYMYWAGLLNEIEGVDIIDKAIAFAGTYRFNGMGGYIQQITFDLSVHFDEANNKFYFYGRQNVPAEYQYSYMVLTCDYNFTTKQFGGFSSLMQPADFKTGNYIRYSNGNLEQLNYGSNDGHETDEDYIAYRAIVDNGIATLTAQMDSIDTLSGTRLNSAIQAFVSASDYCDEICEGTDFDAEVVDNNA